MKLAVVDRKEAGGWAALFSLIGVVSLGHALQVGNGQYHPTTLVFLAITIASLIFGVVFSSQPDPNPRVVRGVFSLGVASVVFQFFVLATEPPGWDLQGVRMMDYLALLATFALLSGPVILELPHFKLAYTVAWLAAFAAVGIWMIRSTPEPFIDVYWWTHHSLAALGRGENPFTLWMPNIYGEAAVPADGSNKYGWPLSPDQKWVQTGYVYPPLSLMISGGGYLFGDMRWASLFFILVGAVALLRSRGRYAVLAAALVLTTPHIFLMLQQGWTDAYCFGLLALTVSLSARSSRLTPWLFGLTIASKQYMIFLVPVGLLLIPTPWDRKKVALFVGKSILAGTIVTLPWLLWNPQAFWSCMFAPGGRPRDNACSFLPALMANGLQNYADSLPFLLLLPTYGLILACSARGAAGFALSSALILSMFFSFAKATFTNQHFLILGCAAAALAAIRLEPKPGSGSGPPAT